MSEFGEHAAGYYPQGFSGTGTASAAPPAPLPTALRAVYPFKTGRAERVFQNIRYQFERIGGGDAHDGQPV